MILGDSIWVWAINIDAVTGKLRMYRRDRAGPIEVDCANSLGNYQVNGTQVVAARLPGWAADTGTGDQASHPTFAAPTMDSVYSQAQAQTLANEVQILSEQIKAIKDALLTHGLIGS